MTDDAKLTRHEEKEHMQTNNNKLANYIDKVRQLQTENRRMTKQIEVREMSVVGHQVLQKESSCHYGWESWDLEKCGSHKLWKTKQGSSENDGRSDVYDH